MKRIPAGTTAGIFLFKGCIGDDYDRVNKGVCCLIIKG